jgi:hypothetical protein
MKKFVLSIAVLLLISVSLYAQGNINQNSWNFKATILLNKEPGVESGFLYETNDSSIQGSRFLPLNNFSVRPETTKWKYREIQ